ncbi:cell wall metabolism sensor histidine kinase WalK [Gorillibacterium massiliense]|uniref:cell wall metabolism sensor histidine kinase WalK n=1 Tax=Gorillibacterium massiliense TaxID=1280390 RepID=UPI0004BCB830|nr:cell wall metabolism sensor histidine kinase WalK [Gorillibacterium massiliense]
MKGTGFFRTIQMKLIIIYVLLILFAMQLIGVYFMQAMKNSTLDSFSETLNSQALLLAQFVQSEMETEPDNLDLSNPESIAAAYGDLNKLLNDWANVTNWSDADIQIIDTNGIVISAYQQNASSIVGHKNTEFVVSRALQNIRDKDNEQTLMDNMGNRIRVLAMPVEKDGKVLGAVYISKSMEDTYRTIQRINGFFLSGIIIALALTALLGIFLSHTITSPIKEITEQVVSVAEGNYTERVRIRGSDEIGLLGSAFNNMTARLEEALSSIEEEKEKLASILSNMSDGVVAADDSGRVMVINDRARQMLGVGLGGNWSMGRPLAELLGLPEDMFDEDHIEEERKTLIQLQQPEMDDRQVRLTMTPIHRRELGTTGTIVVLQDVTEQMELEQSRREFVANVSHELRTPLTTMKSYLEALKDGALEEKELADRFVGVTLNETERMIRLVTDLLHLSRLDSNQARIKKDWTGVQDMLEEVADRFAFQLKQKDISVRLSVDKKLKPVLLDRDKIDQVLDNLVSNAIKYTGEHGNLGLEARLRDGIWLDIIISDNGIGIPKKDLERIFERFYRVDKARSRNMGGTGLGLAIAREIVRAHGGTISLESELNHGTKVTFTLPYLEGSEPA